MSARARQLRQLWLSIHLYLGLITGLVLAIAGISGSLLVFYIELDEWLNPELIISQTDQPRLSYQSLLDQLRASEPSRNGAWRLEIPQHPQRMITARYYQATETQHHGFAPLMVSINPYTGEIASKRWWGQYAMTWLYDLHYTLLLDKPGKLIMAVLGVGCCLSLISGIYLWWPPRHKLKTALSIKPKASKQRLTYDLHKVSGVYSVIVLLMLAITGIALEVPEYINPAINYFSTIATPPKPQSIRHLEQIPISIDTAIQTAQQRYPTARLAWLESPADANGSYRINLGQADEPSARFPKTNLWIDQYSGHILAINDGYEQSNGTKTVYWLHPLHSGEAFGLTGRLLVCASGLALTVLVITGWLRWLQKQRGAKKLA